MSRRLETFAVLAAVFLAACASAGSEDGIGNGGMPGTPGAPGQGSDPTAASGDLPSQGSMPGASTTGDGTPASGGAGSAAPATGDGASDDGSGGDVGGDASNDGGSDASTDGDDTGEDDVGGDGDGDPVGDGDAVGDDRPPCLSADSEGVIIGDSFINWSTHSFPADLATKAGQTWRLYAVGGASMASGGIATLIPDQFEQAVLADPNIKLVLMDGGGNDIMIPAATWPGGAECKNRQDAPQQQVCVDIVDFAVEKAEAGMDRMAEGGVSDVVYFFYPEVPEGTPLGGLYPNAMLVYGRGIAKEVCDGAFERTGGQLRCHFIDLVPTFEGHNPEWFYPTDIHPNHQGSAAMADTIWQYMTDACIGQQASSGCCTP